MNTRRLIIALVSALALSVLVTVFLNHKIRAHNAAAGSETIRRLAAAAKPLDPGAVIKIEDLTTVDWPTQLALPGSFENINDLVGRSVIYPIGAQQPVLDSFLAVAGSGFGLTAKIPEGMRAISVHSDEIVGVAGFLFPGSHVDVLVTVRPDNSSPTIATQTVLQDAEVLTAGQKTQPDPQAKPDNAAVVTLLLKPTDAEKLVLASTQGTIHFVLRNGADHGVDSVTPMRINDLSGMPFKPEVVKKDGSGNHIAPKRSYEVETLIGDKRGTTRFDAGEARQEGVGSQ